MCGIVVAAGALTVKTDNAFKTLLILDALRGIDSTGIAAINRGGETNVLKQVGNPYELMDMPKFGNLISRSNKAIIGHNRWATQGAVSKANAHPFDFDGLVGVHNGTLSNKWKLDDANDFKVDSQNLFHHINKNGLEHAIKLIEGAWSLVWWDKYESTLNFLRNEERPMFIGFTKDRKSLFAASEDWMIDIATSRAGIEVEDTLRTAVDTHYSISINDHGVLGDFERKEVKGAPVVKHQGYVVGGFTNPVEPAKPTSTVVTPSNVVTIPTPVVIQKKAEAPKAVVATQNAVEPASHGTYSGSQVVLEVVSELRDSNGARYANCFDADMPTTDIRLYLKKEDSFLVLQGKEITGTIGKYHLRANRNGYYKVDYNTFRLAKVASREVQYSNPDGELLSAADWEAKHGSCAWCSAAVFADEAYKFTADGDTLCKVCCNNEEVKQLIH